MCVSSEFLGCHVILCSFAQLLYLVVTELFCLQLDYQMYLMPLPRGMDVGNIPKVLKIPYKNDVIELEVNYFYALEPENYISNHGKRKTTILPNDIIFQIDSIDDILANLDKSEAFQNGFRGSSDGKCVKMEQFPKGTVKIFYEGHKNLMTSSTLFDIPYFLK